MKKVVYSISKPNKLEDGRMTGFGCITDEDLIIAAISKNGKPYIRVFENCLKIRYRLTVASEPRLRACIMFRKLGEIPCLVW